MGLEDIMFLIWIALACASISFTITTTSIFKWLRNMIGNIHLKLDELIHCPWCLGHYIAAAVMIYYDGGYTSLTDLIISWFAVISLMGLIHYVLLRAYEPVQKAVLRRQLEKLKQEN